MFSGGILLQTIKTQKIKPFSSIFHVPGDKSISHRAVMLGAMAQGLTEIEGFLHGLDCLHTISCFKQLGVQIEQESETLLKVVGKGWSSFQEPSETLYVGNSGTTLRLMLGILAGSAFFTTLAGDATIMGENSGG